MRFGWIGRIIFRGYSIFCTGETQSDLLDMDLLIYPRSSFRPSGPGLRSRLMQRGLDTILGAPLLWTWRVGLRAHFSNPIRHNMGKQENLLVKPLLTCCQWA